MCERILANQLCNLRGAVLLLDRVRGNECPSDFSLHSTFFWIQIHILQLQAMNKDVRMEIGSRLGQVLEVRGDAEGGATGRCIRVKVKLDICKPLIRWLFMHIGRTTCRVIMRCEKLVDFCFFSGRLDHVERDCKELTVDSKRHYGPWLRANRHNSINWKDIIRDLE